jgi:hypothetical protein
VSRSPATTGELVSAGGSHGGVFVLREMGDRPEPIGSALSGLLEADAERAQMRLLDRVRALIRKSAPLDGLTGSHGRRLALGWMSPAPVRVRSCSVCGGDPRHLCRRCREVIF